MKALCKHANIFGAPGTGSHAYRIGGLAAVDLIATGGLAFLIARYGFNHKDVCSVFIVFIILIVIAIPVHEAFCVNTKLNSMIFGREWPTNPEPDKSSEPNKSSEPDKSSDLETN